MSYSARLRLVDSATKKVVGEALCKSTQGDDKNPPSKDQLLDNKASLLKAYLAKAASGCVNVFSANILNLSAAQNAVGSGAALPTVASRPSQSPSNTGNVPGDLNGNNPTDKVPSGSTQWTASATAGRTLINSNESKLATTVTKNMPTASVATNAGRQLTGEEMRTHFVNLGTVSGHSPSGAKMVYEVGADGTLGVRNLDKGGSTTGTYEIKEADSKICIGIYGGSGWRVMQDCYRLYQIGVDMFAMRSATDSYFFTYIKSQ